MNRRQFLSLMGLGAATVMYTPRARAQEKPNFLFIFADDQTYASIHALGLDEVNTPNLDRLVRNGATFTHAYNQGGWHGAVCVASRTMLITGAFLWNAERKGGQLDREAEGERLWPQLLKQQGYDTYMSGKWHVNVDPNKVFDHVRHVRPGMPKDTKAAYNRPVEGQPDPWEPWDPAQGGYWEGGKHWSEVLGDDAEGFLEHAAENENPFFMYLAFNAPHDPRQSPKAFVDQYPLNNIAVPENSLPQYPYASDIGAGPGLRDEDLAPFPRTEYAVKVHRQEYYAIITHMDRQIGRILAAMEKTGKADNTYIIFTADHGLACGHHGLLGKQNLFDHSVRVPLIINGPGIAQDQRIESPAYLQDVMPTTLDWAGMARPDGVQFKSLAPLLAGTATEHYDAIYGAYRHLQRMVTDDKFKLIYYPALDKKLLFDLVNDPQEMNNLADSPDYAGKVEALWAQLQALQEETGDRLKLDKK
ncbi:sulfatase-like hydrolase/transferase [Roseovarius pacificus]|uniref:sulfatase-like hydrolase/transferase n=1 Tax=Roseovarius pacificus TaxID=337701 RepID=UPI002A18CE0B|nr:sulfatase-like hydrolase/transferase [Roseovarius pacificus]